MRRLLTLPPIMMGRETKILLTLLGTLSSGFVGVLGSKLFVPRPPDGTGPDVHLPASEQRDGPIVDPPSFDRLERSMFSATDDVPASDQGADNSLGHEPAEADNDTGGLLEPPTFWQADAGMAEENALADEAAVTEEAAGETDDAVPRTSLAESDESRFGAPDDHGVVDLDAGPAGGLPEDADDRFNPPLDAALAIEPPGRFSPPVDAVPIASGNHLVTAGDTWWSIAERAYGDGRLYKPLFAWNRAIDPRVALAPGTRLEVPPLDDLATAHGSLLPKDAALTTGNPGGTVRQTSAMESVTPAGPGTQTVVVREGDTLISIARDQLGDSSRWRELYEANREMLGRSPGPLTPGMQLVLP